MEIMALKVGDGVSIEELSKKETIESFKNIPLIHEDDFIDIISDPKGSIVGVSTENVFIENNCLIAECKLFKNNLEKCSTVYSYNGDENNKTNIRGQMIIVGNKNDVRYYGYRNNGRKCRGLKG